MRVSRTVLWEAMGETPLPTGLCNKKLDEVIELIDSNKSNHNIKTMCIVLGVARRFGKRFKNRFYY